MRMIVSFVVVLKRYYETIITRNRCRECQFEFRVQSSRFKVQGLKFKIQNSAFDIRNSFYQLQLGQ
jgi:hypothetical protein